MGVEISEERWESVLTIAGPDEFLTSIGRKYPTHSFLGNSTQFVYRRYVEKLSSVLTSRYRRPEQEIKILDWGCGKGHITYLLSKRGFNVTSCDLKTDELDSSFGQETPIIDKLNIPVVPLRHESQMPFDDSSFDCVVSFGVLEHVASDRDSLLQIKRIVKPDGIVFIVFLPYVLSWTQALVRAGGDSYHDRLYTEKGLRCLAADTGFSLLGLRHAQLFPKNSMPLKLDPWLDPLDRFLCSYTPLKYFATNLEAVLVSNGPQQ